MVKYIDYLRTLLDALTSGYTRKDLRNAKHGLPMETNIGRLFSLFAWGLQLVHEQTDKILFWDNLDNAQGIVLDRYGANFGVQRNGANDIFYRLLIKVKVMSQLSGGDINTVINAVAALYDIPLEVIELAEVFPAKVKVTIDANYLDDDKQALAGIIFRLVKRILAAGVGFIFGIREEVTVTDYYVGVCAEHLRVFFSEELTLVTDATGWNAVAASDYKREYIVGDSSQIQTDKYEQNAGATTTLLREYISKVYPIKETVMSFDSGAASQIVKEEFRE